jgi:hypothetical protein
MINSSKWDLKTLKKKYQELGIDYDAVFGSIKDVIIKTLISLEPNVVSIMNKNTKHRNQCFEVYGFDIIVDAKLKAWLLEVIVEL